VLRTVRGFAADGLLVGLVDTGRAAAGTGAPAHDAAGAEPDPNEVRLDVGGLLLGVSTDHPGAGAALRAAFAAHLTDTPGEPAAAYAITFGGGDAGGEPDEPHRLYDQDGVVLESTDAARVLRALLTTVAAHGDLAAAGLGALPATVVGRGAEAVVVAHADDRPLDIAALARAGAAVADGRAAFVDAMGSVIVGAPGLACDLEALDRFAATLANAPDVVAPLPWGRSRVVALATDRAGNAGRALLLLGPLADDDTPSVSGADVALAALLHLLTNRPIVAATTVGLVGALDGATP
jgi:hypothetical protein